MPAWSLADLHRVRTCYGDARRKAPVPGIAAITTATGGAPAPSPPAAGGPSNEADVSRRDVISSKRTISASTAAAAAAATLPFLFFHIDLDASMSEPSVSIRGNHATVAGSGAPLLEDIREPKVTIVRHVLKSLTRELQHMQQCASRARQHRDRMPSPGDGGPSVTVTVFDSTSPPPYSVLPSRPLSNNGSTSDAIFLRTGLFSIWESGVPVDLLAAGENHLVAKASAASSTLESAFDSIVAAENIAEATPCSPSTASSPGNWGFAPEIYSHEGGAGHLPVTVCSRKPIDINAVVNESRKAARTVVCQHASRQHIASVSPLSQPQAWSYDVTIVLISSRSEISRWARDEADRIVPAPYDMAASAADRPLVVERRVRLAHVSLSANNNGPRTWSDDEASCQRFTRPLQRLPTDENGGAVLLDVTWREASLASVSWLRVEDTSSLMPALLELFVTELQADLDGTV